MEARALIAPPDSRSLQKLLLRLRGAPFTWAYLSQSVVGFHQAGHAFQGHGTHLDTTDKFHQAAKDLREPYLTYLYEIGRQLDSLRWWISTVSYRNGYSSKILQRACFLKVALDLVRKWEGPEPLVLVLDNITYRALELNLSKNGFSGIRVLGLENFAPWEPFVDTAKMLAHRAFFLYRETYRWFQSRWIVPRPCRPTEPTTLLISYATPSNLRQEGEFYESYFGDLASKLSQLGYHLSVAPMILRQVPYKQALHRLRETSLPILIPHRYLGILDLVRAAIATCVKPPAPRTTPLLAGMDIGILIKQEQRSYWISNWAADSLLMETLVRRWSDSGFSFSQIIYIYENQPWERALCWAARRRFPEATLVGYQHAGVPGLLMNFFLAPGGEPAAPLPDRVMTVGKLTARLLCSNGYAPGLIRAGGALHAGSMLRARAQDSRPPSSGDTPIVLFGSSDGLEETEELVDLAIRLFDEDDGIRVVVKCHPLRPIEMISSKIGEKLPAHVESSEDSIIELMLQSSVMVYSGSTVGYEALALYLPVVHLRTQFDLNMDPLEAVPQARLEATGLEELREKVLWLLEHREDYIAQHQEEWDHLVDEMYGPVTDETFRSFVE